MAQPSARPQAARPRIALFIDSLDPGGAETVVLEIARALPRTGHDALVLHFGNEWLAACCRGEGIAERQLEQHGDFKRSYRLPLFARYLSEELRRAGVVALHSHLFGAIVAGAPAAWLAGIPHVATLHDRYIIEERPARRRLLGLARLLGTQLCAVSDDLAAYLRADGRWPSLDVRTVYNGVEVPTDTGARARLRSSLQLADTDVVLVCVARLVELKQHDLLLDALARALAVVPQLRLVVVGDGPEEARLRARAIALNIAPCVRWVGFRNEVADYLHAADAFVLCSRTEGLSRSIAEALSAGLPVIATDVGGNRELVVDACNGRLVPNGDRDALAKALGAIASDAKVRRRMGEAGRRRAQERFSMEAMMAAYLECYGC